MRTLPNSIIYPNGVDRYFLQSAQPETAGLDNGVEDLMPGKLSRRLSDRHENRDKVIIKRDTDEHCVLFSVGSDRDNGTIIDWVKHRSGLSVDLIRKELRPWPLKSRKPDCTPSDTSNKVGKRTPCPCAIKHRLFGYSSHRKRDVSGLPKLTAHAYVTMT